MFVYNSLVMNHWHTKQTTATRKEGTISRCRNQLSDRVLGCVEKHRFSEERRTADHLCVFVCKQVQIMELWTYIFLFFIYVIFDIWNHIIEHYVYLVSLFGLYILIFLFWFKEISPLRALFDWYRVEGLDRVDDIKL